MWQQCQVGNTTRMVVVFFLIAQVQFNNSVKISLHMWQVIVIEVFMPGREVAVRYFKATIDDEQAKLSS